MLGLSAQFGVMRRVDCDADDALSKWFEKGAELSTEVRRRGGEGSQRHVPICQD